MERLTKIYTQDWTDDSIWITNIPSDASRQFLLYVQETGLFHALPKYYTEHKNIASYLVMLTHSGQGLYTYNNKKYILDKNKLVFVSSMEYHNHRTDPRSRETWDIIWVQFNGIAAQGYYELFKSAGTPVISIDESGPIRDLLLSLLQKNRTTSVSTELVSSKILVELLTEIVFTAGAVISPKTNIPKHIQNALLDIDLHFADNLSLDYLSRKSSVSKFHLAKEFKKYTGFTPGEYIINARVNYAKRLLQYTDAPVGSIAAEAGFRNSSYFINVFKNKEGMTPLAFRKQFIVKSTGH